MHTRFERRGSLTELSSYPRWAQEMVAQCEPTYRKVTEHEILARMTSLTLDEAATCEFMAGLWPFIERFPGFMAQNLLKTRYGRSEGDDMARRWLVRNIRVEQNHAEYWLEWAEGAGVPRDDLLHKPAPACGDGLYRWCEEISTQGSLAAGLAAANYAVEGATGVWARTVYESATYRESFPQDTRAASLRWLKLHAAYDDTHPWEALEIVCTLLGETPTVAEVTHLRECIERSYLCMALFADRCMRDQAVVFRYGEMAA